MYNPNEIFLSRTHLTRIFEEASGEICLLGGWAVYQLVNEDFKEARGHDYLGSRDIDLGFHIDPDWTIEDLESSSLNASIKLLKSMRFRWQGFRLFKDFDADTLQELAPDHSRLKPQFEIVRLFVDPVVDHLHPKFRSIFGFDPIDEPYLSFTFQEGLFLETRIAEMTVRLPPQHHLLAMKLNSVQNRNREDKRIKDITDIYALLWFSGLSVDELRSRLFRIFDEEKARQVVRSLSPTEISKAARAIGFEQNEVSRVLSILR